MRKKNFKRSSMTFYSKMFGKYLLLTNTMSCGLMMAAGDVFQQRSEFLKKRVTFAHQQVGSADAAIEIMPIANHQEPLNENTLVHLAEKNEGSNFDYARTKNMAIVGLLQGPFHHYFYTILERILPGKSAKSILKKTIVDQAIASPTCLGIFFFGHGFLEHRNLQQIHGELKLKLLDMWKVDCCFWPPTQFFNFLLVPIRYRVVYINVMTMIYDMFLSYMKFDAEFH